jgi:antitoxin component YwqK of YwqJK toxin-antitoxin module
MIRFSICFSLLLVLLQIGAVAQDVQNKTDEKGKKTGFWVIQADDETTKKEEGNYANGLRTGVWKAYYPDGKLKHQITFVDGLAKGKASFYYPDGTLWEEGNWNEYCWVGEYRLYYPNGQAAYEWSYNNLGRREGVQKYYFENGSKKYVGKWGDGQVTGNVEVYDSTGVLVKTRVYKDGVFETAKKPDAILPQNQDLQSDKSFSPFYGTGDHTMFKRNGKIDKKGYFIDGKLYNGESYVYDENDILRQIRIYENGKLIKVNPVRQDEP